MAEQDIRVWEGKVYENVKASGEEMGSVLKTLLKTALIRRL